MGWLVVLTLGWVALVGFGFRPKHALVLVLFGGLFLVMFEWGFSMLLRSITGFLLIGIVVYLFIRFWGETKPRR